MESQNNEKNLYGAVGMVQSCTYQRAATYSSFSAAKKKSLGPTTTRIVKVNTFKTHYTSISSERKARRGSRSYYEPQVHLSPRTDIDMFAQKMILETERQLLSMSLKKAAKDKVARRLEDQIFYLRSLIGAALRYQTRGHRKQQSDEEESVETTTLQTRALPLHREPSLFIRKWSKNRQRARKNLSPKNRRKNLTFSPEFSTVILT